MITDQKRLEKLVLHEIIVDQSRISYIESQDFLHYADVFNRIKELMSDDKSISFLSIEDILRPIELVEEYNRSPYGMIGPKTYAELAFDLRMRRLDRELKNGEITPQERIAKVQALIPVEEESKNSAQLAESYMIEYQNIRDMAKNGQSQFVHTGFRQIDKKISFMRGHLTVLMARPSIGKSALALNLAMGAVQNDARVLFISIEMNEKEVMDRVLSYLSEQSNTKFKYGSIDPAPYLAHFSDFYKKMEIRYIPRCDIDKLTMAVTAKEYDMIVLDYLQYMQMPDTKTRNDAIGDITKRIKTLGGERKFHALVLSQVRRGAENKEKVPTLEDLRDSGNIEQDADEVLALHRNSRTDKEAILAVLKARTGQVGQNIDLLYTDFLTKFEEREPRYSEDLPVEDGVSLKGLWGGKKNI